MTADLAYVDALQSAQKLLDRRSDVLDFEVLCGFTHWLLGYVLDDIRGKTFPTKQRYGLPDQVAEALEQVCQRSTDLMTPFMRKSLSELSGVWSPPPGDEPALYAHRAAGFSLRRALGESQGPNRRWARGKADAELSRSAANKRLLVAALVEEVFSGLRNVADSFASHDVYQFGRSIKAAEAICQAALHVLWSIASADGSHQDGLEALSTTLDAEVDSDAVQEAGQLAERVIHRIWMRLHTQTTEIIDELCSSRETA